MYVVRTNTSRWVEGSNTEVRVEFEDDAKAEAESWNGPGEDMISKCFWRLLHERWEDVHGDSVTFVLSKRDVQGLVERLRFANSESVN
jgi:hypothetical protein